MAEAIAAIALAPQIDVPEVIKSAILPSTLNIVSGVGSVDGKTSSGWKDVLGKISDAHPQSELANQYGRKSNKEVKTQSIVDKHKKIRQQRTQGR